MDAEVNKSKENAKQRHDSCVRHDGGVSFPEVSDHTTDETLPDTLTHTGSSADAIDVLSITSHFFSL